MQHHRPGDVVNGHVLKFDHQTLEHQWEPVSRSAPRADVEAAKRRNRKRKRIILGSVGGAITVVVIVTLLLPNSETARDMSSLEVADMFAGSSHIQIADQGKTMIIDGRGDASTGATDDDIALVLGILDAPTSVITRMDSTRALDGMQDASWGDFTATWTYHPDAGLDVIITED